MSHPMRSGTMHSLLETILQQREWQEGWAWILEMSGQLNTISARSFGVLEGVKEREFGIGLTIDFLALTRDNLEFRYVFNACVSARESSLLIWAEEKIALGDF